MSMAKTYSKLALYGALSIVPAPCLADAYIEAVPTGWRMQNYVPNVIGIFYTGATCAQGQVTAGALSDADKNRLWSTILTARAQGKVVGLFYETTSGDCGITSFFIKES